MAPFRLPFLGFLLFLTILQGFGQESLKIKQINIYGNDSISDDALLKLMNTKPRSIVEKLEFWKKHDPYSQYTLNEDVSRLKKHYQQNGFLDPMITYTVTANKRNSKTKINIHIKEGRPVLIGDINYYYSDSTSKNSIDSANIIMPMKSKHRFRDVDVLETEKRIKEFYGNTGHPNASVLKDIRLREDFNLADVTFRINSGSKAYLGEITLQGDSLIPRSYINKRIDLLPGEVYSQIRLDKTQQELFRTGLFRYITIITKLDSIENGKVPVLIQVKETPRWLFKVSLGYGTEDKVRIAFQLTRLNFFGGGRTFIFKGQHSFFVPLSLDAKFIQPDVVFKNLDLILNPFLSWEREDSYEVERIGTAVTLQKEITKKTSAYISYNLGFDKVELSSNTLSITEDTPIHEKNNKSGLTLGFIHNTSDDLFSPTRGWKFNTLGTYMGIGFDSQYHYYKLILEGDCYLPVSKRMVLAFKLKGGIIEPVQGDISSPIEDRFLMGGALSLRGWGRNQISPVNIAGDKTGGNTMLESSLELRFPIYWILSGTTFIDFGNTWENSWDFNIKQMLYNFGLGLRIKSPVGPIRFDVATPISDQKFEAQFFITIGHAF